MLNLGHLQRRAFANLLEFQAMKLLEKSKIRIPKQKLVGDAGEAELACKSIGSFPIIIKAQVEAGGRGKGHFVNGLNSGIQIAGSCEQAKSLTKRMLGQRLVTKQTSAAGVQCRAGIAMMVSKFGGVNIESSAGSGKDGHKIIKIIGYARKRHFKAVAEYLGTEPLAMELFEKLYDSFVENDMLLLEINPLAISNKKELICIDAKVQVDDNAMFRHKNLISNIGKDRKSGDSLIEKYELNYIKLEGDIGCMVNGAGLAMATMDILTLEGCKVANFMDVGGSASVEKICAAMDLLLKNKDVDDPLNIRSNASLSTSLGE